MSPPVTLEVEVAMSLALGLQVTRMGVLRPEVKMTCPTLHKAQCCPPKAYFPPATSGSISPRLLVLHPRKGTSVTTQEALRGNHCCPLA